MHPSVNQCWMPVNQCTYQSISPECQSTNAPISPECSQLMHPSVSPKCQSTNAPISQSESVLNASQPMHPSVNQSWMPVNQCTHQSIWTSPECDQPMHPSVNQSWMQSANAPISQSVLNASQPMHPSAVISPECQSTNPPLSQSVLNASQPMHPSVLNVCQPIHPSVKQSTNHQLMVSLCWGWVLSPNCFGFSTFSNSAPQLWKALQQNLREVDPQQSFADTPKPISSQLLSCCTDWQWHTPAPPNCFLSPSHLFSAAELLFWLTATHPSPSKHVSVSKPSLPSCCSDWQWHTPPPPNCFLSPRHLFSSAALTDSDTPLHLQTCFCLQAISSQLPNCCTD